MNILKNNKGEGYVDVAVMVLVFILMIAFALKVYPIFIAKDNLNKFASEIVREVEIKGEMGSDIQNRINTLEKTLGKTDSISWNIKYINGTRKIQLGDPIEVTVKKEMNIGFFKFGSLPITLQAKDSGYSEVYWK
ncbi:Uncharacterised protein [uncultured Clostridium sp.]|nr:Uncharacterised protein [uncultured Clostridium sp.]SCJ45267.1 Uncharacterised protein [uncultured Clostridium sp.]